MGRTKQNLINHVAFVVDASSSINDYRLTKDIVTVVDNLTSFLAKLSADNDQETRVTVYTFSGPEQINCLFYDKDVLRLPSIAADYQPFGNTALRDATALAISELKQTAQLHGDHAFLLFAFTDGEENSSRGPLAAFQQTLRELPDNWTVACLVPNIQGKLRATSFGFPAGNVEVWSTTSSGVVEVGEKIEHATAGYFKGRSAGVKSSTGLFTQVANKVTAQAVNASGMKPLDPDKFFLFPAVATGNMAVHIPAKTRLKSRPDGIKHVEIKQMVESTGRPYVLGNAFYELEKSEKWYGNRRIAVIETATAKVFLGEQAKQLVGITDQTRRIKPFPKDRATGKVEFEVFIESQSTNRLLRVGSRVLLLK